MKPDEIDTIIEHVKSAKFASNDFPEEPDVYQLFNREYIWSPAYKSVFAQDWVNFEIETGKYHIERETIEIPDFEHISIDPDGNMTLPMVKKEFERKVPEDIINVEIMPASSRVLWEEEYDASQDEATSFYIPCGSVIEGLSLEQRKSDGHYYSEDGTLVCFDSSLDGLSKGLLIRADYLKQYLKEHNVQLLWTCIGEKQYFLGAHNQAWSNWKGYFFLENDKIHGEFERYERENQ